MFNISAGSTERQIPNNFEDIVKRSLPLDKVTHYYEECPGAAKKVILNYITFFEERILVSFLYTYLYLYTYKYTYLLIFCN